jgi:hypothetical protein
MRVRIKYLWSMRIRIRTQEFGDQKNVNISVETKVSEIFLSNTGMPINTMDLSLGLEGRTTLKREHPTLRNITPCTALYPTQLPVH